MVVNLKSDLSITLGDLGFCLLDLVNTDNVGGAIHLLRAASTKLERQWPDDSRDVRLARYRRTLLSDSSPGLRYTAQLFERLGSFADGIALGDVITIITGSLRACEDGQAEMLEAELVAALRKLNPPDS